MDGRTDELARIGWEAYRADYPFLKEHVPWEETSGWVRDSWRHAAEAIAAAVSAGTAEGRLPAIGALREIVAFMGLGEAAAVSAGTAEGRLRVEQRAGMESEARWPTHEDRKYDLKAGSERARLRRAFVDGAVWLAEGEASAAAGASRQEAQDGGDATASDHAR